MNKYLPDVCYSTLLFSGELIIIKSGESGYFQCDYSSKDLNVNRKYADIWNREHGISKAQEVAMVIGSMFGWHVPGADPKYYSNDGKPIKPKDKGMER